MLYSWNTLSPLGESTYVSKCTQCITAWVLQSQNFSAWYWFMGDIHPKWASKVNDRCETITLMVSELWPQVISIVKCFYKEIKPNILTSHESDIFDIWLKEDDYRILIVITDAYIQDSSALYWNGHYVIGAGKRVTVTKYGFTLNNALQLPISRKA